MARMERPKLADLVASALSEAIGGGRWEERLPGSRVLAEEFGASVPTVSKALRQLERQGLIEGCGSRKAYRIADPGDARRSPDLPAPERKAIILTHADIGTLPHSTRQVIDTSRAMLVRRGWSVESRTFDFLHAKRPHRSWDHLVPLDPELPMVAVFGRHALEKWAHGHGLRMAFLGGTTARPETPMIAVKSSLLAAEAVRRLTDMGHRRIILPVCDRPPAFADSIKQAVREGLERVGVTYVPKFHTPESDYQRPDVIRGMIESAFASNPPTAIVMLDWKEFVTAACALARMGFLIPRDVSVVILNEQAETDWFLPKLSCFRFPVTRMASAVARWVSEGTSTAGSNFLSADFDEGGSIAPPRER
ncbi:GntR family transcriptional regulator [Haloferula helveola]|uniref:GntR family transcriptional regulator n=3 Tax=Haloferula helveola TaxID=490095 RepID=A0ABN6H2E7_9BACT|nr:GntR family transcriptional regulator [Haloferula helveola]